MNTTNKNMNTNEDDKNKIKDDKNKIIISDANIITNGPTSQYHLIKNINEIGTIMDKNNTKVSDITALIMVLNQNSRNWKDKAKKLIEKGADPNMKINFWGQYKSANDIKNLDNLF